MTNDQNGAPRGAESRVAGARAALAVVPGGKPAKEVRMSKPPIVAFALLCVLALAATPAHADWQYTRWGMSVDEIKQASHGAAGPLVPDDARYVRPSESRFSDVRFPFHALLAAPYTSGRFDFRALFYFDDAGKLSCVELHARGDGRAILAELEAKYGAPIKTYHDAISDIVTWQDETNRIMVTRIGDLADVNYRPRTTAENKGL
jgi:hypothetical protein